MWMRWVGHVARIENNRKAYRIMWESQQERDYYDNKNIGGWIILRWILER
jgi:hypothetical protein